MRFKDEQFEDNGELLLGMEELRQKKKDLNVTKDEWDAVWMLSIVKKHKKIDQFIQQALRDVVKHGGDNVITNFENKFKELRVEGCCRDGGSSSAVMYTKDGEEMDGEYLLDEEDDGEWEGTKFFKLSKTVFQISKNGSLLQQKTVKLLNLSTEMEN